MVILEKVIMEFNERLMFVVIMTKVILMVIMLIIDVCRVIVMIFLVLKKKGELKLKNSINIIKLKRGVRCIKSFLFIFIFLLLLFGEVIEIVII